MITEVERDWLMDTTVHSMLVFLLTLAGTGGLMQPPAVFLEYLLFTGRMLPFFPPIFFTSPGKFKDPDPP